MFEAKLVNCGCEENWLEFGNQMEYLVRKCLSLRMVQALEQMMSANDVVVMNFIEARRILTPLRVRDVLFEKSIYLLSC